MFRFFAKSGFAKAAGSASRAGTASRGLRLAFVTGGATLACGSVFMAQEEGIDYRKVAADIERALDTTATEASIGAANIVRLVWNCATTYSTYENNGGTYGATMLQDAEATRDINAGLDSVRESLEQFIAANPGLSHGDLWTLAAVTAIRAIGGPTIGWYPGRRDLTDSYYVPPAGRIPGTSLSNIQLRAVFDRLELTTAEGVALLGLPALFRTAAELGGEESGWTKEPLSFNNSFFQKLMSEDWVRPEDEAASFQLVDKATGAFGLTPTDVALISDPGLAVWVKRFAGNEGLWRSTFRDAFAKIIAHGVPAPRGYIASQ